VPGYELYFAICYFFIIIIIFLGMFSVSRVTFDCFTPFIVVAIILYLCSNCKELALIGLFQCDLEYLNNNDPFSSCL